MKAIFQSVPSEVGFKAYILPMKNKLFRLALQITLDREEAEDIVQETMMKMWLMRHQWKEIDDIEAFTMTICRNLALDSIKRKEHLNISLDSSLHDREDSTASANDTIETEEQKVMIEKLINLLPEKQRTVMLLRDIEEKSYKEIADIMQITEADVKVSLHRARNQVRDAMAKWCNGES